MNGILVCAIAFVLAYVGSMPLAGPIAVWMITRAAERRFGEARRIGIGAALSEGIYAALAFWGFATFLARQQLVVPISRAATAVILTAVGGWVVFWKPSDVAPDREERKAGTLFIGFWISAFNPTLLITWSTAVAFLYSKGLTGERSLVAIPFGACAALGVASWNVCVVHLLEKYGGRLPKSAMTWVVRTMGLVLVGLGLWAGVQFVEWARDPHRTIARTWLMLDPWRSESREASATAATPSSRWSSIAAITSV
jgi:threonine/homoserine/homoserine lactone efflux protein